MLMLQYDITSALNGCELQSLFTDNVLSTCGGSSLINRTWTVFDCMGNQIAGPMSQVIKVFDTTAPTINCPANITVSTNQNTCTGSAILASATVSDACSAVTTTVTADNGIILGNFITALPLGVTTVTITATDACDNTSNCTYTITVEDQVPPTPICETTHTVALTSTNPTLVPALVFDDGSYDACGALTYQVSRMEGSQCTFTDATSFGDFVPFYCCDIGERIMVALRVSDAAGNSNTCMVEVIVQDKLNPSILCPTDKTLDCHQDYTNLSVTGQATAIDNCGPITPTYTDNGSLNSCGIGTIFRTWTADDGNGNTSSCVQRIIVENQTPFYINPNNDDDPNDDIVWPRDFSSSGCTLPSATGTPTILNEDLCSQVNFLAPEDVTLSVAGGCARIFRTWTVFDNCQESVNGGCGNFSMCEYPFTIKDCKAPTPNVLTSITTELMANLCMVEIAATAWDNPSSPSFDNCGIAQWLVRSPSLGANQGNTPPADATTTWTFSGSGSVGTRSVDLWLQDINGNWTYITSQVLIQDNNTPPCASPPAYAIVSGGIENEEGEEVGQVMVEVSGDMEDANSTDNTGAYSFDLPINSNYAITPERNDNPLNGVSTYDLVKISQHILGVEALSTPYKLIAADINKSGNISTLDLVALRRLILFIDRTQRTNETTLNFLVEDQNLIAGNSYTVDFNLKDIKDLQAYQFTLAFDTETLVFENIIPGTLEGMSAHNFGTSLLSEGIITSSWHTTKSLDTELAKSFSIKFTALANVALREALHINSTYTKAQAYFKNEVSNISLAFESEHEMFSEHFQLLQNRPNPFKGETVIGFHLPQESPGTLTLYDISGRVLKVIEDNFKHGYNELNVSSTDLSGHGVFYYRLEVENHVATRKMVLLQ